MPWSSGLGALGITTDKHYVDYRVESFGEERVFRKFEARYIWDEHGEQQIVMRSWWRWRGFGWKLMKREDQWGTWQNGRRRPAMREAPAELLERSFELRKFFKPYQHIDWYGEHLEVISYPSPERWRMTLMVREPGDPTTLREIVLEEYFKPYSKYDRLGSGL